MEILERLWELVSAVMGGLAHRFERTVTSLFGSSNARYIKKLQPRVDAINALAEEMEALSDEELRAKTDEFRDRLAHGETEDDILVEAFAVCREAGRRYLHMRHYDVQLMGGMVLHSGGIAEMVTGEGKTLVATLPAYLNAISGRGVHVVTVNDYLARRDMEWMGPVYLELGLTVGAIQGGMDTDARQRAYACDITYGTNNEFGFDYLRDNMRPAARGDDRYPKHMQQSQGELNYAIVDEVDNILIDEARTPLIISGPAHDDVTKYAKADRIARQLKKDVDFEIKEKEHSCHMTDDGVREAERLAGVESFYTAGNMQWPHLIDNSLKAHHLYKRDVNYVVQDGEIIIVDEFTGRPMPGRNWSDGLHQAVEAKEGVRIKEENQTLATITLQNFFKLYNKLGGMTGTAMTEAAEFWKIYQLDVVAVPTHRELSRISYPDVIYRTESEKYSAIGDEIERIHKWDVVFKKGEGELIGTIVAERDDEVEFRAKGEKQSTTIPRSQIEGIEPSGRPILVGTVSIERSERLSKMLDKRGVPHEVLNAKHHAREADIIAQAGRKEAVTIATNMAGRGTDIVLGGNPETMAWAELKDKYETRLDVPKEEWNTLVDEIEQRENMKAEGRRVAEIGGLHVIATERHEARRIDLQLRGRCGRQGDPGSSRFFLSLEDDLMRIFAGEWVKNVLTRLGMQEGEAIESKMVSRRIEGAQKKVEERNFEVRKNLLEYDEVMDEQRKRVYGYRQAILDGADCGRLVGEMIEGQIDHHLDTFLANDYGTESFTRWASTLFSVEFDPRDFRGMDFESAERHARDEAERQAESQVFDAVEENLPLDEEPREWNWDALAKTANRCWNLNLRDRDLKKVGRDDVAEMLIDRARDAIQKVDVDGGKDFLASDFGVRSARAWVLQKFGIDLPLDEVRELEAKAFKATVLDRARTAFMGKEIEFPVMAGIYRFTARDAQGNKRYDRDGLAEWARDRFDVDLTVDDMKNRQRDEIRNLLLGHSRRIHERADELLKQVDQQVDEAFVDIDEGQPLGGAAAHGVVQGVVDWANETLRARLTLDDVEPLDREELRQRLHAAVEDRYRPEFRRMVRALLLQLLDSAWKEHLLTMDHLRASVGLRGYAQVDPKVEYKREGMRAFDIMWQSVGERVTDLIFRMEQLDESFVGSMWVGAEARHEEAPSQSEIGQQQEDAIRGTEQTQEKREPIRNRSERVGRNDPCPCGSGKKFKNCCMRSGRAGAA